MTAKLVTKDWIASIPKILDKFQSRRMVELHITRFTRLSILWGECFLKEAEMRGRIVVAVAGLLLYAAPLFAQQGTASIGGKVVDQGGGVLPGVALVITNDDTGIPRELI